MGKQFQCKRCGHICHCLGKKNTVNEFHCDFCSCVECSHVEVPFLLTKKKNKLLRDCVVIAFITLILFTILGLNQ